MYIHRTRRFHTRHIITPRRRVRRLQASSRGSKPSHEAAPSIRGRPQSSFLHRFTFKFRSVYVGPHYPSHSALVLRTLWRRRDTQRPYHSSCIPCDLHGHPALRAQCRERQSIGGELPCPAGVDRATAARHDCLPATDHTIICSHTHYANSSAFLR